MSASQYRLKGARGPRLELDPHPESCDLEDIRAYAEQCGKPLAIDLFCCGGGLSLGLEEAGFDVILGVDLDEYAVQTHRSHFGGVSLQVDLSDSGEISRILAALEGVDVSLVAGSPPCQPFSRAGSSKIRSLVEQGVRSEEDERRDLWKGFLRFVRELDPSLVLMENVPDLVSGEDSIVFRQIVDALEDEEFDVHTRILPSWQFGVPQHRQRLFIAGVKAGASFSWPRPVRKDKPGVEEAISDLPVIEAGKKNDGLPYVRNGRTQTALQKWFRRGQPRGRGSTIHDHFARSVRKDDLRAFRRMTSKTRYSELPADLRRYTTDHFDDRYKRLDAKEPSRTITAHIARDGYWYIHPTEHRTLTMREAARIQSFPDRFRFAGTPSHAFRQIGEAVPPLVARAIGRSLLQSIKDDRGSPHAMRTRDASSALSEWIRQKDESELRAPWRMSRDLWLTLMGMVILGRRSVHEVANAWSHYRTHWPDPESYLADNNREAQLGGRNGRARELLDSIAIAVADADASLDEPPARESPPGLSSERWKMAWTLAGRSSDLRSTTSSRRLVERVSGMSRPEAHFTAQMAMARLVGVNQPEDAYSAILEIGDQYCRPKAPLCDECPIKDYCISYMEGSFQSATPSGRMTAQNG